MGYTEDQALGLIMVICSTVQAKTPPGGEFDLTWLAEVYREAQCRKALLPPK